MERTIIFTLVMLIAVVFSKPLDNNQNEEHQEIVEPSHSLWKRFINPFFSSNKISDSGLVNIRTRRDIDDECEKLQLCKLHARSSHNFFAAFQLYFVSKQNARLWDHQARSAADCESRFSCYYK